ncbi:hypothetical protein GCM10027047_02130 [Rhodococcus aerolatus]
MTDRLARAAAQPPQAVPPRAHVLDVTRPVGHGEAAFHRAAERVATWHLQRSVGFRVRSDGRADEEGTTVLLGVGVGPLRSWAGCRVTEVVSGERTSGFSYATLAGHPEQGVERFTVSLGADGTVTGRVQAWSRPAWAAARLAGPLGRLAQRGVARRYLASLTTD